jgi:Chaperone of endosialidase/Head domain of trimeric autotransporter adhesin
MKKLLSVVFFLCTTLYTINAQNIGIGTNAPHSSSILHVSSTTKGFLMPSMTKNNRDGIGSPATGLLVFQNDNNPGFYYYTGSAWQGLGDHLGNHILSQNLATNNFYISKTGLNQGIQSLDNGAVSIRTKNNINNVITDAESFRFDTLGNILAIGKVLDFGSSSLASKIPIQGAGTRFMWYASRGSLRFGRVSQFSPTDWDDANMDDFTFAGGNQVKASGYGAFAYGDQVNVTSTVGVGFGSAVTVNGTAGFSAGASNTVNGFAGTAIGYYCRANGQGSVALGYRCSAANNYSVALGYRATNNGYEGTMVMGDESTIDSVRNTNNNQFAARYAGGFRLYTAATVGGVAPTGAFLLPSGNSWGSISDSTKKEHFVQADKEYFLAKLSGLKLGSWQYKEDASGNRHYGPMAQEIFSAYGTDGLGKIGCDTVLTSADMDGIMMIMLQGLEKRSSMQKEENLSLKAQLTGMALDLNLVREENKLLKEQLAKISQMQEQILALKSQLELGQMVFDKQTTTSNKKQ